jgi:hypothetical protein
VPSFKYTQQWRWVITDILEGAPLTTLDRVARERSIQYERNQSTLITSTQSSDDPSVNTIFQDINGHLFPYLAEGDRLLYCLRRDYGAGPDDVPARVGGSTGPWYPRAAGVILQYDDAATSEDGNTTLSAYDPWEYLRHVPVIRNRTDPADNELLHNWDVIYPYEVFSIDEIIIDLLEQAKSFYNVPPFNWGATSGPRNMFVDWGWSAQYAGTIETVAPPSSGTIVDGGVIFEKGTSIADAFAMLIEIANCDIVLTPIYDPVNRPGILCELSVFNTSGAQRPGVQFAWDYTPWSVEDVSRLVDGTGRANRINLHTTQGGDSVGIVTESTSVNRFGEYWLEQWFMQPDHSESLAPWAQTLKDTISEHPRTVQISPLPERSPEPFIDYFVGDEVEVLASSNLRATMSGFQRVHSLRLNISDDALESVEDMAVYIPGNVTE